MDKKERDAKEVRERLRRLDRSLKYCIKCGKRLRPDSKDDTHKKCEDKNNKVPKYNNDTGDLINNTEDLQKISIGLKETIDKMIFDEKNKDVDDLLKILMRLQDRIDKMKKK